MLRSRSLFVSFCSLIAAMGDRLRAAAQWWSGLLGLGNVAAILSGGPLSFMIKHISSWVLNRADTDYCQPLWRSFILTFNFSRIAVPVSSDLCWTAKLTLCHSSKGWQSPGSALFSWLRPTGLFPRGPWTVFGYWTVRSNLTLAHV